MHYLSKSLLFPSVINQMHVVLMQLNLTVKSLDILLLNIFSLLAISILLISVHRSAQKEIGRIHRLAGLRSCFKDHGLDPEWVEVKSPTIAAYGRYSADNSEYQNGYDMASQALDEHTSSTAFVGNNDMTAFGIMAAISDHGFRVPHDYSVCGFDNIPLSSMPQIALTTIEHASLAKGREAVDIIYKKNTQKNISAKHHYIMRMEYEPELIVRNSTGKCKQKNVTTSPENMTLVCIDFHTLRTLSYNHDKRL